MIVDSHISVFEQRSGQILSWKLIYRQGWRYFFSPPYNLSVSYWVNQSHTLTRRVVNLQALQLKYSYKLIVGL